MAFEVLNRCKHRLAVPDPAQCGKPTALGKHRLAVSVIVGRRRHATIILSIIQKKKTKDKFTNKPKERKQYNTKKTKHQHNRTQHISPMLMDLTSAAILASDLRSTTNGDLS